MSLDLDSIRRLVSIRQILDLYRISLQPHNHYSLSGPCPIHHGDNPNAFHVDLQKNLFHCFTRCGGGSIFDLVMKIENVSFYQAARIIHQKFLARHAETKPKKPPHLCLIHDHPYLAKRNVSPTLARFFQMGFCNHGLMKNRIAIPVFDRPASVTAYCGRATDDLTRPKYLFPKYFPKKHHLFNIQNITPGSHKHLFIVEGFFDCIHLTSLGFDALALMGSSISSQQIELLKQTQRKCILMLDGDEAGYIATLKIAPQLKNLKILANIIYLQNNTQPEYLDYHTIKIFTNIP